MKPTLEEYVEGLKADLAKEISKREESEYRHAVTAEALENLLDQIDNASLLLPRGAFRKARKNARIALNGVVEGD